MIKTSKDVLSKKDIQHISTNVELESDGVLVISIMSSTPRMWQRFTFTPHLLGGAVRVKLEHMHIVDIVQRKACKKRNEEEYVAKCEKHIYLVSLYLRMSQ